MLHVERSIYPSLESSVMNFYDSCLTPSVIRSRHSLFFRLCTTGYGVQLPLLLTMQGSCLWDVGLVGKEPGLTYPVISRSSVEAVPWHLVLKASQIYWSRIWDWWKSGLPWSTTEFLRYVAFPLLVDGLAMTNNYYSSAFATFSFSVIHSLLFVVRSVAIRYLQQTTYRRKNRPFFIVTCNFCKCNACAT